MQATYYCWDKPWVHIYIFLCRWKHKAHNRCELIGPQTFFFPSFIWYWFYSCGANWSHTSS